MKRFIRLLAVIVAVSLLAYPSLTYASNAIVRQGREAMMSVVLDELNRIDALFPLPPMTVASFDTREKDAITVVSSEPVRYVVVVEEWRFWYEPTIRRLTAHESYHALAAEHSWPNTERLADLFADCVSSVGRWEARCEELTKYIDQVRRSQR